MSQNTKPAAMSARAFARATETSLNQTVLDCKALGIPKTASGEFLIDAKGQARLLTLQNDRIRAEIDRARNERLRNAQLMCGLACCPSSANPLTAEVKSAIADLRRALEGSPKHASTTDIPARHQACAKWTAKHEWAIMDAMAKLSAALN